MDRPEAVSLKRLSWLAGHWAGLEKGVEMEEAWLSPKGGILIGVHRDVFPNGRAFFEFLRIAEKDGNIVYHASPGGGPSTAFPLLKTEGTRAVFENRDHDFPQRILYERTGDLLKARIEGLQEGEPRFEEWTWKLKKDPS